MENSIKWNDTLFLLKRLNVWVFLFKLTRKYGTTYKYEYARNRVVWAFDNFPLTQLMSKRCSVYTIILHDVVKLMNIPTCHIYLHMKLKAISFHYRPIRKWNLLKSSNNQVGVVTLHKKTDRWTWISLYDSCVKRYPNSDKMNFATKNATQQHIRRAASRLLLWQFTHLQLLRHIFNIKIK